ncbi:MAG: hypothetical protein RR365_08895 [Bacteroides sp.]
MEMQEIINQAKQNIGQALADYEQHTTQTEVLDDVTGEFICALATDSSYAKQSLRELFSKSPVWDEKIDALVINGTRTHNPDPSRIKDLGWHILRNVWYEQENDLVLAMALFHDLEQSDEAKQESVDAINRLAPKAYGPTKKPSRVFKALCTALGVADETAGSEFQRLYAQFADELTAKKISFKLYVSINPAHFLTMSNPKYDRRGNTLTSCHSFNSTEYQYNNGCSGYARDDTSFIVFTVSDPKEPETLNNRKTTRQIFAYRPGSGLLLQSRMYNTSGGTYGGVEDSKLYRDLVQREISALENQPNLWKTGQSVNDSWCCLVREGDGFGGYADWTYNDFDGHISCRTDCDVDEVEPLTVGTYGLCVKCGCETSHGVYCDDCEDDGCSCDDCGDRCDETYEVRNSSGETIRVCEDCRDNSYTYCDECEEYHPEDDVFNIDGRNVCDSCRDEYYEVCDYCDEYHHRDDMTLTYNNRGNEIYICNDCRDEHYACCDKCSEYSPLDDITFVHTSNGDMPICSECIDEYEVCPECCEQIEVCGDGTCPACGAVIKSEEEEA